MHQASPQIVESTQLVLYRDAHHREGLLSPAQQLRRSRPRTILAAETSSPLPTHSSTDRVVRLQAVDWTPHCWRIDSDTHAAVAQREPDPRRWALSAARTAARVAQ